jgi:hypothetical protein
LSWPYPIAYEDKTPKKSHACAHQGHKLRLQFGTPVLPIDSQHRIDLWYPVAHQPVRQRSPPDAAPPDSDPQQFGVGLGPARPLRDGIGGHSKRQNSTVETLEPRLRAEAR